MMRLPLAAKRVLDPREARAAAESPLADSVNIPAAEIPARPHELPPSGQAVLVAEAGPPTDLACDCLRSIGREAIRTPALPAKAGEAACIGRLWTPNAFLAELAPSLRPAGGCRALDAACGSGRDAVFLASLGRRVLGVDVLPDALERAQALAARCAAAIEPMEWSIVDLEREPPAWSGRFDLITMFRFLHRPLFVRMFEWLRPGGTLVFETFTTVHRARHGRPARDGHVLEPGELADLLRDYRVEQLDEGWRDGVHTARAVARRP